jgi:Zn-dependent protease
MIERSQQDERTPAEQDRDDSLWPRAVPTPNGQKAPDANAAPPPHARSPYPWLYPSTVPYPPPPEYYLQRAAPVMAPPPAEHAHGGGYPAFAPDGRVNPSSLAGAAPVAVPATYPVGAPLGGAAQGRASTGVTTKSDGVTNLLLPLGSALVSFALYTLYGGWQFGLGLVLLLLVHEMGHFIVIRAKGLPASLPVFIPFLGAYVAMRRMPASVRDEAEIALAGPLAGALGGGACFVLAQVVGGADGNTLLFLAYFSFFINLINLLPVTPLDGGHIVGAISRWLWPIGLALLAAGFVYTFNLWLLLLGALFFSQTLSRFRISWRQPYYAVSVGTRFYVSALYFGLALGLGLALYVAQSMLPAGGLFGQ